LEFIVSQTNAKQAPFITIQLAGGLCDRYGREHRLRAWSVSEGIYGLAVNYPDLRDELAYGNGFYQIIALKDGRLLDETALNAPADILIAPAVVGAGGTLGRGLLGGALLVAGAFTGGSTLLLGGASLLGGAILNTLSPKQRQKNSDEELKRSDIFEESASAVDSDPCPRAYGRIKVRAKVLSQNISVSDIPVNG
jgi:predicted phage tail protein